MNGNNKPIHWYPGHMAVATREIEKNLKIVDMIIELIDARAPISSRHPFLANYPGPKSHLIVMSKTDLADPRVTSRWEIYFKERKLALVSVDLQSRLSAPIIISRALEISRGVIERQIAKGMKPQPIRAMVIGIPNVGKSTLINLLARKSAAEVSDRPGVTRAPQWIKPNNKLWLLDTPGVLPMNYDLRLTALHLAAIGSIRRDILPLDDISSYLYKYIRSNYPKYLERYLDANVAADYQAFLQQVATRFGLIDDIQKAAIRFYDDFKSGKIGRVSLEVAY